MKYLNIFSHEKKSDRLYIFTEGYSNLHRFTIGVIIGEEKILVIDSGLGMTGDLRKYIESVVGTEKPIICACSHAGPDHVGSAMLFDEAYLNNRDYWMRGEHSFDPKKRLADLEDFGLDNPEIIAYGTKNMLDNRNTVYKYIDEGDIIDLGGVKLETIAMPGHSAGSIAYFNREEKYCFTGDAISIDEQISNVDLYYNTPEHRKGLLKYLGIQMDSPELTYAECYLKYRDIVNRFISIVGEDVTLYSGHVNLPMTIDIARKVAQACDEIAAGMTEFDPPAESIFKYQKTNPKKDLRMHFAGNVDVVYNRTKFNNSK